MTDSKIDALNVQTNVHIALRLLREGKVRVVQHYRSYITSDGQYGCYNDGYRERVVDARDWHAALQQRFRLHPAVDKLLGSYRPKDWQQLVLEYPHQAESDRSRLAYTQTEQKGERDIQTVTSLGKYLTRHFPQLPDHEIRNTVASYTVQGCRLVRSLAEMINALQRGPHSCMRWGDGGRVDLDSHPYRCYDPRLGWAMAVREEGGDIMGRALVYEQGDLKIFVRTYMRPSVDTNYSQADDHLNAWLKDQGYKHVSDWEGCHMAFIEGRHGEPLAPYLDGNVKTADLRQLDGRTVLRIQEDGEYTCDNTDGTVTNNESGQDCEDCDERVSDGDGYWVYRDDSRHVCQGCLENNYSYVYGRGGHQYYVDSNDAVYCNDEYYHDDYLSDNDIVQLECGEYAPLDSAVFVESCGEYYDQDDDRVCYDDYNNRYELRDDCVELVDGSMCHSDDAWMCEATDGWYSDDDSDERVEIDGCLYHKDNAPVDADETTTETTGE